MSNFTLVLSIHKGKDKLDTLSRNKLTIKLTSHLRENIKELEY